MSKNSRPRSRLASDLPTLFLLGLVLFMPAWAVSRAGWTEGLDWLPLLALIALAAGYLLAVSSFSGVFTLLAATAYGFFAVWMLAGGMLDGPPPLRERLLEVTFRLTAWLEQALGGGFSRDNLIFVVLTALLAWYLGYNAAINVFRWRQLWPAVIPPALILLINTYYYTGPIRMDWLVIACLFVIFALAVQLNVAIRERIWQREGARYTRRVRFDLLRGGLIAAALLVALAWLLPPASASDWLSDVWAQSDNPWYSVRETWQRLFGALEGEGTATPDYYGGPTLSLGGPVSLGSNTVLLVYAPEGYRYYWRSKVFDTYLNGRWTTSSDARLTARYGGLVDETGSPYRLRRNVQQRFEVVIPATRLLYAASQPISFASLEIVYDVTYTAPGDQYGTVMAARAAHPLRAGDTYTATSSISFADEASLRAAGTDYPDWVRDHYLQLPDTVTGRTRQLAASLTEPYDNPYDAARAIEAYLRTNMAYNSQIAPPPLGADPVDYFLFESRQGYCNYYASAMVILLRAQGIPARLAVGFAQGRLDPALDAYRVIESDAHAWVEVYFPGYGWVEFEPTSIQSPIYRPLAAVTVAETEPTPAPPPSDALAGEEMPEGELTPRPANALPAGGSAVRFRIPPAVWWILGLLTAAGLAGAVVWFWLEERGLRSLSEISRSYARLNIYASLAGLQLDESATPYERARLIARAIPEASEPASRIVELYVQEQYAPPPRREIERFKAGALARDQWQKARPILIRAALTGLLKRLTPFPSKSTAAR